jgi:hypothetical protein
LAKEKPVTDKLVPFTLQVKEVPVAPDYFPAIDPAVQAVLQGTVAAFQVSLSTVGDFAAPVTLAILGLPAGALAGFDVNPLLPGGVSVLTIQTTGVAPGDYDLQLQASA